MTVSRPSASMTSLLGLVFRHRSLIAQLAWREIAGRYKGSIAGFAWSFAAPLILLSVYTFVFSSVFKAKWGVSTDETTADFALLLFAGLCIHTLMADCLGRAPTLITGSPNLVKKVVFPLEVLPWASLLSALFNCAISISLLLIASLLADRTIPLSALVIPTVLLPLCLLAIGTSYFLAALGVYVRDIGHMIPIVIMVMLFASPVFYPVDSMPIEYRSWFELNPLSFLIETSRGALLLNQWPDWEHLLIHVAFSTLFCWTGFACFQRLRNGFADVM